MACSSVPGGPPVGRLLKSSDHSVTVVDRPAVSVLGSGETATACLANDGLTGVSAFT